MMAGTAAHAVPAMHVTPNGGGPGALSP
jgi:hypothetical protein